MTPFFAHTAEAGAQKPNMHLAAIAEQSTQAGADSERRSSPTGLSDAMREDLIAVYGKRVQECMANAHGEDSATWLSFAQIAQQRMYRLINGRSAAQVAQLEQERGLA